MLKGAFIIKKKYLPFSRNTCKHCSLKIRFSNPFSTY